MKIKLAIGGLILAMLAAEAFAGATNYVATAVNSTNTATSIVVARNSRASTKVLMRIESDAHLAFGGEATTNSPIVAANTTINLEYDRGYNDYIGVRGTNNATTPRVNVWIIWQ